MNPVTDAGTGPMDKPGANGAIDGSRPRVVVGVDGSPGARAALAVALTEAARRGAGLDVVSAYPMNLVWTGGAPLDVQDAEAIRVDTERRAGELVDEVQREESVAGVPGLAAVPVRVIAAEGRPVPALLEAAEGADLLVVGSRGRGAMRSALLGSVALHSAGQAPCPVLVVHPGVPGPAPRVVVGVDGSAGSRAALAVAVDEAARSGAEVEVVASYVLTDYWTPLNTLVVPSVEQIRNELQRRTEDLVQNVLGERAEGGATPTIRTDVVEGAAGEVLVDRARDADLLVVGSQGRGAVRGLLLGSVALHCAMHAPGPVMVVHEQRDRSAMAEPGSESAMAGR
jgi:nucleotide-binding universal stress UspA family protein